VPVRSPEPGEGKSAIESRRGQFGRRIGALKADDGFPRQPERDFVEIEVQVTLDALQRNVRGVDAEIGLAKAGKGIPVQVERPGVVS